MRLITLPAFILFLILGLSFGDGKAERLLPTTAVGLTAKPSLLQDSSPKELSTTKKPTKKSSSKKKKRKKPAVRVSGTAALQTIYDDNILRMSGGFIDEFRRNDPAEKFETETYDDAIISPRLFLTFRSNPLGKKETRLYLSFITWQYMRNPIKDNGSVGGRLRQYVQGSNFLELNYGYSPTNYIKNLSDRNPFDARSSTPIEWKPFKGVRHGIDLMYSHRLHKRFTATIEGGRVLRFYNRPFMENDNWEWNGNVTFTWSLHPRWRLFGKYMYADAEARALDDVTETKETSDDGDGSYERDLYEAKLRFRPKGGVWYFSDFEIKGQLMKYFFTGDKPIFDDTLHTGRKDEVGVFEAYITTKKIYGPISLKYGYRYAERSSSLPGTFEGEDAEDKDYKNNRTWFEVRYAL